MSDCGKHRLDETEHAGCAACAWLSYHAERERAERAEKERDEAGAEIRRRIQNHAEDCDRFQACIVRCSKLQAQLDTSRIQLARANEAARKTISRLRAMPHDDVKKHGFCRACEAADELDAALAAVDISPTERLLKAARELADKWQIDDEDGGTSNFGDAEWGAFVAAYRAEKGGR